MTPDQAASIVQIVENERTVKSQKEDFRDSRIVLIRIFVQNCTVGFEMMTPFLNHLMHTWDKAVEPSVTMEQNAAKEQAKKF